MVHADLRQRVAIATRAMPWTTHDGIEERLLERIELRDSVRRTSIVRLGPAGWLPVEPARADCVDLLVLEGELRIPSANADGSDLVLPTGWYLHAPVSPLVTVTSCTVFVKQRPASPTMAMVDATTIRYEPGHTPGLWRALLHTDEHGDVVLLGFDPGTTIDRHRHDRGEEFFVLAGEIEDEQGRYGVHDWVRQPADSVHTVRSPGGCLFFTFAHHL